MTYAIDDGHSNQLTCGLSEYEARRVAQRMANDRGESVYLYEDGPDGEYEEVEPADSEAVAHMTTHTICSYTGRFQAELCPAVAIEAGDFYRVPEDPDGTGTTADAREWDEFARAMRAAGLDGHYDHTANGWDYYRISPRADDE